jgi:hypothetical protein
LQTKPRRFGCRKIPSILASKDPQPRSCGWTLSDGGQARVTIFKCACFEMVGFSHPSMHMPQHVNIRRCAARRRSSRASVADSSITGLLIEPNLRSTPLTRRIAPNSGCLVGWPSSDSSPLTPIILNIAAASGLAVLSSRPSWAWTRQAETDKVMGFGLRDRLEMLPVPAAEFCRKAAICQPYSTKRNQRPTRTAFE